MVKKSVSVVIITYNQEKTISKAIESVLEQKDISHLEILIGDDRSSDTTGQILNSYKIKYPDIIFKIFSRKINIGPSANLYKLFENCTSDYIAILEGDDFWTDSFKLKKQIQFLEKNNSYVGCVHRYMTVDEDENIIQSEFVGHGTPNIGTYTIDDFKNYIYFGHIGTLVFRNLFQDKKIDFSIIKNGHNFIADISLNLLLSLNGKIEVLQDNMAAIRQNVSSDGSNYKSVIFKKNQVISRIEYLEKLKKYALEQFNYDLIYTNRNEYYFAWSILYLLRYPSKHNLEALRYTLKLNPNKLKLFFYLIRNLHRLFIKIKLQLFNN